VIAAPGDIQTARTMLPPPRAVTLNPDWISLIWPPCGQIKHPPQTCCPKMWSSSYRPWRADETNIPLEV